jgi:hypothetical protein
MDESVLIRILLAREFIRSGVALSQRHLPIDRMTCDIQLDLALELLLNTVLSHNQVEVGERDVFPTLVGRVCELDQRYGAHRSALGRLHSQRNRAQHDGLPPSEETCRVIAVEAEAAFRSIAETAFGVEPDQLSLEMLLEDERVRTYLSAARLALADANPDQACAEAATAFNVALGGAERQFFPHGTWTVSRNAAASILRAVADAASHAHMQIGSTRDRELPGWVSSFVSRLTQGTGSGLDDLFQPLLEPFLLAAVGIDLEEFRKFKQIVPSVVFTLTGDRIHTRFGAGRTIDEAHFAVEFATRTAVRLQSLGKTAVESSGFAADQGPSNGSSSPHESTEHPRQGS